MHKIPAQDSEIVMCRSHCKIKPHKAPGILRQQQQNVLSSMTCLCVWKTYVTECAIDRGAGPALKDRRTQREITRLPSLAQQHCPDCWLNLSYLPLCIPSYTFPSNLNVSTALRKPTQILFFKSQLSSSLEKTQNEEPRLEIQEARVELAFHQH